MDVIITGASSGIGKATALLLSKQPGYHVFAGVRNESALQASSSLTPVLLDVTIPKTIQKTVMIVSEQIAGKREIALINNAGVIFMDRWNLSLAMFESSSR
jgi:NAD(P)-dependent dehydrogenase (short-subunit alcohol dehydrogenase family)